MIFRKLSFTYLETLFFSSGLNISNRYHFNTSESDKSDESSVGAQYLNIEAKTLGS